MSKKTTINEYQAKIQSAFKGNIWIDQDSFINMRSPITARCIKHDEDVSKKMASQLINAHYPCPTCHYEAKLAAHIERFHHAIATHYNNVKYTPNTINNIKSPISIWCDTHGWQKTNTETVALKRFGCNACARIANGVSRIGEQRVSYEAFVAKVNERFDGRLQVVTTKEAFINQQQPVTVTCNDPSHPEYTRTGTQILKSSGCKHCKESQGERLVRIALKSLNFPFEQEKRFATCRDTKELPFDFWLPKHGVLIEFQGLQHRKAWSRAGGEAALASTQRRDRIKAQWAKAHNIDVLYISSYQDIAQQIVTYLATLPHRDDTWLPELIKNIEHERLIRWQEYKRQLDKQHQGRLSFTHSHWEPGIRQVSYECVAGEHGEQSSDLYSLLKGHGCALCAGNTKDSGRIKEARQFATQQGGECHSSVYHNTDAHLLWSCALQHYWFSSFDSVIKRGSWCPWCSRNSTGLVSRTITTLAKADKLDLAISSIDSYVTAHPQMADKLNTLVTQLSSGSKEPPPK